MARRVAPVALRSALLLTLALAAAGCGKSKERQLYEQRQTACAEIQGLTVSAARQALINGEDAIDCRQAGVAGSYLRLDAADRCGGADTGAYLETVCELFFVWSANDPDLCDFPGNGCVYACVARVDLADATPAGNGFVFDDALVCARRWIP
jgi:uncharacterized protein YfiM (DUF2279 family)